MSHTASRHYALVWLTLWATARVNAEHLTVHIIFSNHLDVGFDARTPGVHGTDSAAINVYFDRHFKTAVDTAEAFRAQNRTRGYRWMTHAWLISMFFDCPIGMGLHCPTAAEKQVVSEAIRRGDIYWHALPFNGQAEFFDAALLEYSAFLVHQIDDQFKLPHKRVASLRDVPGMTRAAIPILNRQGIVALSQGVNGASAPPGLPLNSALIWEDKATGGKLVHWIHAGGYSGTPQDAAEECLRVASLGHVLCHAWKQDNEGPHTFEEASSIFDYYAASFPGAELVASDFDSFFAALEASLPDLDLPRHSAEIGDTWIYGIPSDAAKVSRYLATLRLRNAMQWRYDDYAFFNFSRLLMKVPEHTWGVDIKTTIADYANWDNAHFHALLKEEAPNFLAATKSWQRQAMYVDWALEALGLTPQALEEHLPTAFAGINAADCLEADASKEYKAGSWRFAVDPATGGLARLQREWGGGKLGVQWASSEYPLAQFVYDTFVEADFSAIFDHYTYSAQALQWATLDFGKANCSRASPRRSSHSPTADQIWSRQGDGDQVHVQAGLPDWTWKEAGGPQQVWSRVYANKGDGSLHLDISLLLKTATRLPEAGWIRFQPDPGTVDTSSWLLYKLGQPISPLEVMLNGSRAQHAVSPEGISVASLPTEDGTQEVLNIRCMDAVLVSPGRATPFPVVDAQPDMTHGVSFGLLNNIWGTNYPQWQPFDASGVNLTFRFVITASRQAARVSAV